MYWGDWTLLFSTAIWLCSASAICKSFENSVHMVIALNRPRFNSFGNWFKYCEYTALSSSITEKIRLIRCDQKSRFLVHEGPKASGSTPATLKCSQIKDSLCFYFMSFIILSECKKWAPNVHTKVLFNSRFDWNKRFERS